MFTEMETTVDFAVFSEFHWKDSFSLILSDSQCSIFYTDIAKGVNNQMFRILGALQANQNTGKTKKNETMLLQLT